MGVLGVSGSRAGVCMAGLGRTYAHNTHTPQNVAHTHTTQASLLDPSKPLPPALPALLSRALGKPWPPKAEFFALSLLRPLLLRPAFPTPELVTLLVSRVAAPEVGVYWVDCEV